MRLTTPLPFFSRETLLTASILAALLPTARAADFTSGTSRVLSDPTYLLAARQFVSVTEFFSSKRSADVEDYAGTKQYSSESSFQTGYQSVVYGITDRLNVGASVVHISGDADIKYVSGAQKSTSDSGTGLAIGTTFRVLEQINFPVSLDLSAVVRTGGASLGMSVAVGHKTKQFTIQGLVGANHFNGVDYTAQPEGVPAWLDASWRYFVGVQTQTRLTDLFSVNLGMSYSTPTKSVAGIKSGTSYTKEFADAVAGGLSVNYHFIPNKLVGKLGYSYVMDEKTLDRYANPALNATVDNHKSGSVFVGLLYEF